MTPAYSLFIYQQTLVETDSAAPVPVLISQKCVYKFMGGQSCYVTNKQIKTTT